MVRLFVKLAAVLALLVLAAPADASRALLAGLPATNRTSAPTRAPTAAPTSGTSVRVVTPAPVTAAPTAPPVAKNTLNATTISSVNGVIVDADGNPIAFHGISWSNLGDTSSPNSPVYNGFQGNSSLSLDTATQIWRMKLLGFNLVRYGFTFQDFNRSIISKAVPCQVATAEEVIASVTPPGTTPPTTYPTLDDMPEIVNGTCNSYMPQTNAKDQFLWTVKFLVRNGFYVMVDFHPIALAAGGNDLDVFATTQWIENWTELAKELVAEPALQGRIIFDWLNEPDSYQLNWQTVTQNTGTGDMYKGLIGQIHQLGPPGWALYCLEGTGQYNAFPYVNWGDGFITDESIVPTFGNGNDPNPYFQYALQQNYLDYIVLCPHVYGPSVTSATDGFEGNSLYYKLDLSFGTKKTQGYPDASGHKFPIIIGETASEFVDPRDNKALSDMAFYLNDRNITGWVWWTFNTNSPTTGTLVSGTDFVTINWTAVSYLQSLGLKPFYVTS